MTVTVVFCQIIGALSVVTGGVESTVNVPVDVIEPVCGIGVVLSVAKTFTLTFVKLIFGTNQLYIPAPIDGCVTVPMRYGKDSPPSVEYRN